jgi:hypothetical protein
MSFETDEVITVALADVDRDAFHVRRALQYGATQRAKVRLVVGAGANLTRLDDLIEAQLAHLGQTLGLLPPVIEVQCPSPLRLAGAQNDG